MGTLERRRGDATVVLPRPMKVIRRGGKTWRDGRRPPINVCSLTVRPLSEHQVAPLKEGAPTVVRVGNLDAKPTTSDGHDRLGLLDDPLRDWDSAVRLRKRFRPPGTIVGVWIAAFHPVPPEIFNGLGVDDDAFTPRVGRGLVRLALGFKGGVRLVAPRDEVELRVGRKARRPAAYRAFWRGSSSCAIGGPSHHAQSASARCPFRPQQRPQRH